MRMRILLRRADCSTEPWWVEFDRQDQVHNIDDATDFALKFVEIANLMLDKQAECAIILVETEFQETD